MLLTLARRLPSSKHYQGSARPAKQSKATPAIKAAAKQLAKMMSAPHLLACEALWHEHRELCWQQGLPFACVASRTAQSAGPAMSCRQLVELSCPVKLATLPLLHWWRQAAAPHALVETGCTCMQVPQASQRKRSGTASKCRPRAEAA